MGYTVRTQLRDKPNHLSSSGCSQSEAYQKKKETKLKSG